MFLDLEDSLSFWMGFLGSSLVSRLIRSICFQLNFSVQEVVSCDSWPIQAMFSTSGYTRSTLIGFRNLYFQKSKSNINPPVPIFEKT